MNNKLSPHETLYLHEILSFKNTCAVKSSSMQSIIQDQELKILQQQDITNTKRQMQELQSMLNSGTTV